MSRRIRTCDAGCGMTHWLLRGTRSTSGTCPKALGSSGSAQALLGIEMQCETTQRAERSLSENISVSISIASDHTGAQLCGPGWPAGSDRYAATMKERKRLLSHQEGWNELPSTF